MEAPLNWAKRLSKWDKIDFLADAQATVEAWKMARYTPITKSPDS
jgi:hypothetical protein